MIKGKNIQLRLIKQTDLPELYEKWHDAESRGLYYPLSLVPETIFQQEFNKNGLWSDQSKRLLITDLNNNMLGLIHCFKAMTYSDCIELSYILFDTKNRNKGYATEAVQLTVDYLFNNERLNRIQALIPLENKASIRVIEKVGFKHEGVAREVLFLNGKDVDLDIYSILRSEWLKKK